MKLKPRFDIDDWKLSKGKIVFNVNYTESIEEGSEIFQ